MTHSAPPPRIETAVRRDASGGPEGGADWARSYVRDGALDIAEVPESPGAYPALEDASASLIFVHVPKSAGTTLKSILHRYMPLDRTFMTYGHPPVANQRVAALAGLPEPERAALRFVSGHTQFGLHKLLVGPYRYVTTVREPVSRVLSHYVHVKHERDHELNPSITRHGRGVVELMRHDQPLELNNGQTRLLSGIERRHPFGQTPDDLLDLALENLERHFLLAGLTERFDASLVVLARHMGWRFPHYRRGMLSKGEKPTLDPRDRREIEALNDLDRRLYDHAAHRLDRQLSGLALGRARVRAFALLNNARRKLADHKRRGR